MGIGIMIITITIELNTVQIYHRYVTNNRQDKDVIASMFQAKLVLWNIHQDEIGL